LEPAARTILRLPAIDGPTGGVKVATGQFTKTTNPDNLDRDVLPEESRAMFDRCINGRLPLRSSVVKQARCLYTVTPDHGFIIDRHPEHQNILLASPCSGHGFKHSAAIGESLAQLAIDGGSDIDVSPFALSRFNA
jgi:sarcosine oxidase